ncbi:hypothetical protein VTJ49DRAFT_5272 [Mycothermus thermophilus]|uniref:Protein HRI1 n=1 Tax=Humicola insolens TaxID=85995 RepID=A0ABR3VKL2_HUMIN
MTTTNPNPNSITIRLPSQYPNGDSTTQPTTFTPPPLPFLYRTWTVTHSTLRMWRSARNVRITYGELPPKEVKAGDTKQQQQGQQEQQAQARMSDLVESEFLSGKGGVRRIEGIDTATSPSDTSSWDWRGKPLWLRLLAGTSHWEVLGWGERVVVSAQDGGGEEEGQQQVERWMVTWFAPTLFTAEGIDIYSDRREGGSEGLVEDVLAELKRVTKGRGKLGELVEGEMRKVEVVLPWKEA